MINLSHTAHERIIPRIAPLTLSLFKLLQSAPKRMHEFKCEHSNETTASLRNGGSSFFSFGSIRFIPLIQRTFIFDTLWVSREFFYQIWNDKSLHLIKKITN